MKSSVKNDDALFATRIDLPINARERVTLLLDVTLATLSDLYTQTKYAHWNVKGMNFIAVHKLFDELAESVETIIDEVAERMTALGGVAHGTVRQAADASEIEEFPADTFDAAEVIAALADRYGHVANACRRDIEFVENAEDHATVDLLTQASRTLDQAVYFLGAHEL